jgi:hypothetical protein
MERWVADGVSPMERAKDLAAEVPHWRALDELAGRGTVADTTALRLAYRGFPTRRYQEVLHRHFRLDEPGTLDDLDPYGEHQDAAFALSEGLLGELGQDEARNEVDRMFRASLRNVGRSTGEVAEARQAGLFPHHHLIRESAIADVATLALGGLPAEARNPVGGNPWPHARTDVKPWLLPYGASPRRQTSIEIEHRIGNVVAVIPVTEHMLRSVGSHLSDDELADLAALYAPIQAIFNRYTLVAVQAWAMTGGAFDIDYAASTPQLAMIAEATRPAGDADLAPPSQGTLVLMSGGPPGGPKDEQLVLRRRPKEQKTT